MIDLLLPIFLSSIIFCIIYFYPEVLLPDESELIIHKHDTILLIAFHILLLIYGQTVLLSQISITLVWISIIDIKKKRISNKLLLLLFLLLLLTTEDLSIVPTVLFSGFLIGINLIYIKIKKINAFGMGDIKIVFLLGLFWGWNTWVWVYISFVIHVITFLLLKLLGKDITTKTAIPFAPAISLSFFLSLLINQEPTLLELLNEISKFFLS